MNNIYEERIKFSEFLFSNWPPKVAGKKWYWDIDQESTIVYNKSGKLFKFKVN